MNINQALHELGVTDDTLTQSEKEALDRDGFLPLPGILEPEQAEKMRALVDELVGKESNQYDEGVDYLDDLVDKDPVLEVCFTHPRVLAAIAQVLGGEFKHHSLNSRISLPGYGQQRLHADWGKAVEPGDFYICNSIWLLVDFTEENGATRVVPGTHLSGELPSKDCPLDHTHDFSCNPLGAHPDEVKVLAPAGTVVVFNSHVWHSGTLNNSPSRRLALHSAFVRRDQEQLTGTRNKIRPETYNRLNEAARYILDL